MRTLLLALLLSALTFSPAQASPLEVLLHVTVLYDSDHNGEWEGVGIGKRVYVSNASEDYVGLTNLLSSTSFALNAGLWHVDARVPHAHPLFAWHCQNDVLLQKQETYLIVRCTERLNFRIPWLKKG